MSSPEPAAPQPRCDACDGTHLVCTVELTPHGDPKTLIVGMTLCWSCRVSLSASYDVKIPPDDLC